MAIEIERKFLVTNDTWKHAPGKRMTQGYLSLDPARTVRVRIADTQAFLTIKGLSNGASRLEFEYAIPVAEAQELLALCHAGVIDKVRHTLEFAGKTWEVDCFLGENQGLVVAEIELTTPDEYFESPDWLGAEVTSDARYYNASLSKHPYSEWSKQA